LRNCRALGEDHGKSGPEWVTNVAGGHWDITLKGQEALQIPDHLKSSPGLAQKLYN